MFGNALLLVVGYVVAVAQTVVYTLQPNADSPYVFVSETMFCSELLSFFGVTLVNVKAKITKPHEIVLSSGKLV